MFTVSLLSSKVFGDREVKEEIDNNAVQFFVSTILMDAGLLYIASSFINLVMGGYYG